MAYERGHRQLRRRCEAVLAGLDLPRPFSVEALCRNLAEQRGRPLHLHVLPPRLAAAGACGLWLATDTDDHIFFERRTTRTHQEHIVLHEAAHLLFDHGGLGDGPPDGPDALLGDLDPRLVRRLFARTGYTTRQEREAETLASLIRTTAMRRDGLGVSDGVLGNLEAALGVGEVDGR
ncbi:hypothetical protein AB0C51_11555 [Streptomyces pathocidini]|uniref:hypothetical protein n=1 Tax=Streptomyces pathocidini TaxID=1650571 RepID=UPI0033FB6DB9